MTAFKGAGATGGIGEAVRVNGNEIGKEGFNEPVVALMGDLGGL